MKTPKQLDREGGWWSAEDKTKHYDVAEFRRSISTALPHWLKLPRTPREEALAGFRRAESERAGAAAYIGGGRYTTPSEMTPTQLRAALNAQARRFAGVGDNDMDFSQKESA